MSNPVTPAPRPDASPARPRRVFITVAEVSGDKHAAQFVRALRELDPAVIVEGHGGPEMAAAGATIHRETVGKAAMGWRGALRAAEIYGVLRWTRKHFDENPPDLQVGVDSPSMNFHFARAAKERNVPVLQYVAPQLWGWAPWRMKKLRRWVDRVACVLPFEEEYFRRHGVNTTFVGHPLFDELPPHRDPPPASERFPNRPPVIGIVPGSRKSVAAEHFPLLLQVAARIEEAFPEARFLVPTTAATHAVVQEEVRGFADTGAKGGEGPGFVPRPAKVEYRRDAFDEMVPRCDFCLTVSGTATLHVAGYNVPMIVVYYANPVLWQALGRWLIRLPTRTLVNLLAVGPNGSAALHVTPEFTPWYGARIAESAELAIDYLRHPEKLEAQRRRLDELVRSLDKPGASMNVARIAMEMMRGER